MNPQEPRSAVEQLQAQRASLSPEQARLLNHVWDARLREKRFEWPPVLATNLALDLRGSDEALRIAPPGTLFVVHSRSPEYGLSLLGVFLTEHGKSYLGLLARYLEHICARAKENPRLPENKRIEVAAFLRLSSDESFALGHLISLAQLWGSRMSRGEEWSCGYPADIDRLRFVPDRAEHLANLALEDAERVIAQTGARQAAASRESAELRRKPPFRFVRSRDLRLAARADWREARLAHRFRAWRSCVFACGAVLEAMLLDAAEANFERAQEAFSSRFHGRRPAPLRRWSLHELAEACAEMQVLGEQGIHLTHALRFSRDLVHPGRAVRVRASIGKPDADIALGTVRHVHGLLLRRWRGARAARAHENSPGPAD